MVHFLTVSFQSLDLYQLEKPFLLSRSSPKTVAELIRALLGKATEPSLRDSMPSI